MAERATLPALPDVSMASFIAANGTLAKILVDVTPAQIRAAISGETAKPGEASVRQRALEGGARVIGGQIASTDGTARDLIIWIGQLVRTQGVGSSITSITGTNTINAGSGSFITDGIQVGDGLMLFGATNSANNGLELTVTAVTALSITVNGTSLTNETLPTGARLFRVARRTRKAIPINAGTASATPPVALLGGTQDVDLASQPDTGLTLGPDEALIVGLAAAVSALPARIDATAHFLRY